MATATRTRKPAKKTEAKVDGYQLITDQIIAMLEAGTAPWRQSWTDQTGGLPMSMASRKAYRGINVLVLGMTAMARGYTSNWWGTYKQIEARGGQVRKSEKSTQVVYWSTFTVIDEATGKSKTIPSLRIFRVFNADQADGDLKLPQTVAPQQNDAIAECDAAVAVYLATGPRLTPSDNGAWYNPSSDLVGMPERTQFNSSEEYYGTLFHELTHSTGHVSRLKRDGIVEGHRFGDELYSKEELIAEMGSAFLSGFTGIDVATLSNSASYLASWIKVLKGDKKLLMQAASAAQKATDLILGISHDKTEETTTEA